MLYYKSKEDEELLKTYSEYTRARNNIEIVPMNYEKFDAFSFIDFVLSLNEYSLYNYYVKEPVKTISHTKDASVLVFSTSKLHKNQSDDEEFAFKIRIEENFKNVQVFVRNNMKRFDYSEINENLYITFIKSNFDHFQICDCRNRYPTNSLIHNIAIYFANVKHQCPTGFRSIFENFQSNPTKNKKRRIGQTDDLIEMIMSFPGMVKLILQGKLNDGHFLKIKPEWKNYEKITISSNIKDDETYSIYSVAVLFPWANNIINHCNFIELDACFKSLKPYCFSVCNGIHMNESYPMGISICPTEAEILYQIYIDLGLEMNILQEKWNSKSLLSDMHPSLCSFAENNCKYHYICQRHIYEYFGSNSGLYCFVSKVLKCYSFIEYDEIRLDIIEHCKVYYKERQMLGKTDETFMIKYKALLEMLSADETKITSKWHYTHWAIWSRSEYGISTCSNHSEGFHTGANKVNSYNVNFISGLSNLLKKVISHANSIPSNHGKSLKAKCKKFREYIISKLKEPYSKLDSFCKTTCNCGKGEYLSSLYGSRVVCEHMILQHCMEYIEKLSIKNIKRKEIILLILEMDEDTPYQKLEKKIFSIKKEIIEEFHIKSEDHLNIEELIKSVLKCFQLEPGPGIQFDIDYNFQKLIIDVTDLTIDFNQRNNSNNDKNQIKTKIKKY